MLLRQIYRPHNVYCLHIDPRSELLFLQTARSIINCYRETFHKENIFLVDSPINVTWSHFSMLQADLLCIKVSQETLFLIFLPLCVL